MKTLRTLTLIVLASGLAGFASADDLKMDGMAASDVARPARGMTQSKVESEFGTPSSRVAAVGDPPISRWEYPGFVVYFEYDKVIHAVAKR
jgi:hypothetical protein